MLDGWRAISISLVLAGHMLPLGPKSWRMNEAIAANGMAIFFTLSGFFITSILLRDADIPTFLIRRLTRIVPLAWLALLISFSFRHVSSDTWIANLLFYANLPPFRLDTWSSHYWSLDVEVQFYGAIATLVALWGAKGLRILPVVALSVTGLRIWTETEVSIVTWLRVDEILAGAILALLIHGNEGRGARLLAVLPFPLVLILFALSTRSEFPVLEYGRPYIAAAMVGITILRPVRWLTPMLESRSAAYLARTSYAVYIIHHFTMFGWLGSGQGLDKYIKRPMALTITFVGAHVSTFYFEKYFIDLGHRLTAKRRCNTRSASRPNAES